MQDLHELELKYRGNTEKVFFRELSGGEQLAITKGQKLRGSQISGEMEIDVYSTLESGQKLVAFTLVNDKGKNIYTSLGAVQNEKTSKVQRLIVLAKQAAAHFQSLGEDDEPAAEGEPAGND